MKQNTDMESNEEKLHKMIIQSKINDTKDVMKRKAIEIDKQKLDREARARETKQPAYIPSVSSIPAGGRSPMHNDDHTPTYTKSALIRSPLNPHPTCRLQRVSLERLTKNDSDVWHHVGAQLLPFSEELLLLVHGSQRDPSMYR